MLIEQPPSFVRSLYPEAIWRMEPEIKKVYLTFDDGPIPGITPWVVRLLGERGIKATFFLVGDNVRKHPDEHHLLEEEGHRIGNHTFNHIRGFEYSTADYMANVGKANSIIHSSLFRPPHGHLLYGQYKALKEEYIIIMWDVVTRDYSRKLDGEQVLQNVKRYTRNGSIITFHDSLKAEKNMKYALPRALDWLEEQGYDFDVL